MDKRIFLRAVTCFAAVIFFQNLNLSSVLAQECVPADITLSSQLDVDNFQANHGSCNRVSGELRVEGDDIIGLAGLSGIEEVYRLTIFRNPLMENLQGLSGLIKVTHLDVFGNPSLFSLQGMTALEGVGGLSIVGNASLTNLRGLESLDFVNGVRIRDNSALRSMQGLSKLTDVINWLEISGNSALESLDGLEALHTVLGELTIEDNNALNDIDGLASLSTLAPEGQCSIRIQRNASLAKLDGLSSLTNVPCSLIIHLNDSLSDISGLSNLASVGHWLHIAANPSLANLAGLEQLTNVGSLGLINNASLSDLSALSGLQTVAHLLEITWNHGLSDLVGFSHLTSVGIGGGMMSGVRIENNAGLQSLNGLSTIQAASRIYIRHNPSLADCLGINVLIDPIDDYEPGPGPGAAGIPDVTYEVSIHDNSAGCNSVNDSLGKVPIVHLNPGLSDAWFNPETSGQGYFIIIFPMIKQIFLAWFTYDTERPPEEVTAMLGEPGHRWITAQGEYVDNEALLEVWVTHGGTFDSGEPPPERYPDGEILLKFSTCNAGTITYDIPSVDLQGIVPVQRITLDNVALCYRLNAEAGN